MAAWHTLHLKIQRSDVSATTMKGAATAGMGVCEQELGRWQVRMDGWMDIRICKAIKSVGQLLDLYFPPFYCYRPVMTKRGTMSSEPENGETFCKQHPLAYTKDRG